MNSVSLRFTPRRRVASALLVGCLALAPSGLCLAAAAAGATLGPPAKKDATATLEQCVSAPQQSERSATFAGEMDLIPGTTRMEMRIDVLERSEGASTYRTVSAPGLGVWRGASPGVRVYRYLKQVTNLAGPAFYRAAVSFRWLGPRGRLLASSELRTRRCEQAEGAGVPPSATGTGTSSTGTGASSTGGAPQA